MITVVVVIIGTTAWLLMPRPVPHPFVYPSGQTEHTTICIGGDSDFTPDNGVVGGNGTAADPYIIAGWYIKTSIQWDGRMAGIQILNANVHFIVRNCYVSKSESNRDWGIYLASCANGTLENNNCSGNEYGIFLGFSSNITISNNSCFSNQIGVVMGGGSTDNTMIDNTCSDGWYGISLASSRNTLMNNTCASNRLDGIRVQYQSGENTLRNNTCSWNGGAGIDFYASSNNIVIGNTCSSNDRCGISLYWSCDNNHVTRNEVSDNGGYAIAISSGVDNLIYGNAILDNNGATSTYNASRAQAYDDNGGNSWYVSGGIYAWGDCGNYWSDLTAPDIDGDGVVDDPYMIAGNAGAEDWYPLTYNPLYVGVISIQ